MYIYIYVSVFPNGSLFDSEKLSFEETCHRIIAGLWPGTLFELGGVLILIDELVRNNTGTNLKLDGV